MPSWALTPPLLQLSDGAGGHTITIDSTGAKSCVPASCSGISPNAGFPAVAAGTISWSGTIGVFSVAVGANTALGTPEAPDIDISTTALNSTAPGILTISLSAVGFDGSLPFYLSGGTAFTGVGSVVYSGYASSTNVALATSGSPVVGPATVLSTCTLAACDPSITGPSGTLSEPFSLTLVEAVTLTSGGFTSDAQMAGSPAPPLGLTCSAATGTVGTPYSSKLVATGGVPPYNFTITGGSISPLTLVGSLISGTPTVAGTLNFTAEVTDSSGNTGHNTATASCDIVVAPSKTKTPPLTVLCPANTATVGVPYSSQVPVTGGTPPYTYAIVWGSLPDGLTLNTKTGVIGGTPLTGAQTGSFRIEVTDSTGATAYTNCSGSCSNGTTITYGGGQPQGGWGQKGTSTIYTSDGLPLTVYGYDTSGHPTDLYSNNVGGNSWLGLSNWSNQNQIDTGHFVQCDISAHGSANGVSISVGTSDWNATYDVYGSNTQGQLGTCLKSNVNANTSYQSIPNCSSYKYICVKAHTGNCQVQSIQFNYPCSCAIDVGQSQNGYGQGGYGQGGYGQGGYGQGGQGSSPGQCGW